MDVTTDFQGGDFTNWPVSIDYRPRLSYEPTSLADLVQFLKTASQNDRRVRAVGTGWSLSDVAVSHDYLVTSPGWGAKSSWFSRVLAMSQGATVWGALDATGTIAAPISPVLTAGLNQQTLAGSNRLVHAEAGISLMDLYAILDYPGGTSRDRWALPTMGGSAGQTLAGAISTSVHGGDFSRAPFPGMVRAIDIAMADGQRYWIEREDQPITSAAGMAAAFAADPVPPVVRYDTAEFLTVLVSFGSMGIIYSLVIEVVEQYALSQQIGWTTWSAARALLADRTLLSNGGNPPFPGITTVNAHPTSATDAAGTVWDTSNPTAYGLELIINPYRLSCDYVNDPHPDREVLLACRAMAPIPDPVNGPKPPGPDQLALLVALNDFKANDATASSIPGDVHTIITASSSRVNSSGFLTAHTVTDTYGYSVVQPCEFPSSPVLSIEVVLPTRNGAELAFVDALLAAFDSIVAGNAADKFAGIFSLRYCQATDAYLSMQSFGPEHCDNGLVCNIEIGCLHNVDALGNRIYGSEDMVGLKDGELCESSSRKHMEAFERLVRQWGARLHWGQISFTNSHNPQFYPNYSKWRQIRGDHSQRGSIRLFDSDFTTRYQISASNVSTHWTVVAASLLPGAATVAPADATMSAADMPPTGFLSAQDCLEVVVAGSDGQVCWTRQPAPGQDLLHWSWVQRPDSRVDNCQAGNVTLAPQFGGRLAIGVNSDSHPEVFAWCASDTGIYHAWRNLPDNTWNSWTQLKGDTGFSSAPDAALAADGMLAVVARGTPFDVVRWTSQNNTLGIVGWNDWGAVAPLIEDFVVGPPSIAIGGDSLLRIYVTTTTGFIAESKQASPAASAAWGAWSYLGPQTNAIRMVSPPGVGRNHDGTLELFAVSIDSQLFHLGQNSDFTWPASWAPVINGDPFVVSSADRPSVATIGGAIHVAVLATDGTIVHYQQQGSGYAQQSLGGPFTSPPAITADSNGLPAIFAKFANDIVQQWHPTPVRPNLFAYDPRAGAGELYSIDAEGGIALIQNNPWWLTGYYLGVAGRFAGTELPSVLVYDSTVATASFYTFDDQGSATQLSGFSAGATWSRIACGNLTGGPFDDLVFYDPLNGVGEFYTTDGQGNIRPFKRYTGWRNSWSAMLSGNFTGGIFDDLLLYDPQAGEGELYTTDGHGNITLSKSYTGWRTSWTHILPGHFTGSRFTDLLFYDEIAGYAELYSTDGRGNLALHSTFAGWQGWTFAVPGYFTGRPFMDLFLYNPVTETGELYTSDGAGNLTLARTYPSWPHYWGIVLPLTG